MRCWARRYQPWNLILPLGISFFVFQKISYLIDLRRGDRHIYGFLDFCMFVTFFPQLIAGPIVRHNEIIHQFRLDPRRPAMWENLSRGFVLFVIGVAKKVALADTLAMVADPLFGKAVGASLSAAEAWIATAAYTLQIYFDFSGYSDMAIGLALMFGLRLPLNFNAPYRAVSIRDFWRRWHMTLSRFLRDYLYIPLGGNRCGPLRQAANVIATMLLGGLWHGANWTFVAWGGLHGAALAVNHVWQGRGFRLPRIVAWALTLLFVMACWVLFRSADFATAGDVLASMVGMARSGPYHAGSRIRRGADRRRGRRAAWADQPGRWRWRGCSRRRGWPCRPALHWRICCCWLAAGCRMSSSTSSSDTVAPGAASSAWPPARAVLAVVAIYAFVVLVDPFDTLPLSPPADRVPVATNARFAFPSLARSDRFDSAIFGTSTSRLLRPVVLNAAFGARFANLSMNAATAYEQSRLMAVFRTAHPAARVVMVGLDISYCMPGEAEQKFTPRPFPAWMYDGSRWRGYGEMFNLYAVQEAGQEFGILLGIKRQVYGSDGYTSFVPPDSDYDPARVAHASARRSGIHPAGRQRRSCDLALSGARSPGRGSVGVAGEHTKDPVLRAVQSEDDAAGRIRQGVAVWRECKRRAAATGAARAERARRRFHAAESDHRRR